MKSISILGSTGSIGTQTLDVIRSHPKEFRAIALSGFNEIETIQSQVKEFRPKLFWVGAEEKIGLLERQFPDTRFVSGKKGLVEVATFEESDTVIGAIVGFAGLRPTVEAIKQGKSIGLANKETLVAGGEIVMDLVRKKKVPLLPIDSEHSALFQCLNGENRGEVKRMILTCSGGPFKFKKRQELEGITASQALAHPTWSMGGKITIDSATLVNKGLEVIEAKWLYDMPLERIETILHPQSIVHSMVEFVDGSTIAQLGTHDMRLPIQYALSYPKRLPNSFPKLDLEKTQKLEFYPIDHETFPGITYAKRALSTGGSMPCAINAANEIAVHAFLNGKIKFLQIFDCVQQTLENHKAIKRPELEDIFREDEKARKETQAFLGLD